MLIAAAAFCHGTAVGVGGQDCHTEASGPFTGNISAEMLKDAGATYVSLGHSERRAGHNETNKIVHAKAKAALRAGLAAIICVGETRAERDVGDAMPIVGVQLAGSIPENPPPGRIVVAYEPVWAIGSGLTPAPHDIAEMHGFIRDRVNQLLPGQRAKLRILEAADSLWRISQARQRAIVADQRRRWRACSAARLRRSAPSDRGRPSCSRRGAQWRSMAAASTISCTS